MHLRWSDGVQNQNEGREGCRRWRIEEHQYNGEKRFDGHSNGAVGCRLNEGREGVAGNRITSISVVIGYLTGHSDGVMVCGSKESCRWGVRDDDCNNKRV